MVSPLPLTSCPTCLDSGHITSTAPSGDTQHSYCLCGAGAWLYSHHLACDGAEGHAPGCTICPEIGPAALFCPWLMAACHLGHQWREDAPLPATGQAPQAPALGQGVAVYPCPLCHGTGAFFQADSPLCADADVFCICAVGQAAQYWDTQEGDTWAASPSVLQEDWQMWYRDNPPAPFPDWEDAEAVDIWNAWLSSLPQPPRLL
jgi:hypothetical protein